MAMKSVWGRTPAAMLILRWFHPKLAQFIPKPAEPLRGAISPTGHSLAISILIFWGTERGRSDLDHGFNHQPSAWLHLHWCQGPGEGTWARAQHCAGKSFAVPSSGYLAPWGHSRDQKVAPARMQQRITLGSTSTGTSRAFQG